ncbi:MAG TPA: CHAD domain-containing protein, partial [Geminicoccaceae bacterium]|nr:CHAD domain-containing protein [Geminicoccaceae bacterium]
PVCEAELELKAGRPAGLYRLALRLHQDVPLVIETESKAGRGYALAAGLAPGPRRAGDVRLAPEMSARDAFRAVARDCVAQILGSQACALRGEDPEGVHQMRVGLRRLRSALGSFRDHLPGDRRRAFNGELRWLGERLGRVRDLDVFATETLPGELGQRLDEATRDALTQAAGAARAEAQAELRRVLRSPRYTELMLKLLAWIEDGDGTANETAAPPMIGGAARDILGRRHRSVARPGRRLHRLDAAERHELRKRAKKLRYAAEFFRSLCPDRPHRRYIKALKGLQEGLGAMNDAAVARRLLAELAERAGLPADGVAGDDGGPLPPEPKPAELKKLWGAFADRRPLHKVCGGRSPAGTTAAR